MSCCTSCSSNPDNEDDQECHQHSPSQLEGCHTPSSRSESGARTFPQPWCTPGQISARHKRNNEECSSAQQSPCHSRAGRCCRSRGSPPASPRTCSRWSRWCASNHHVGPSLQKLPLSQMASPACILDTSRYLYFFVLVSVSLTVQNGQRFHLHIHHCLS